jgi:hypothetical protein
MANNDRFSWEGWFNESFLVDGELESWQKSAATAFSLPLEVGLDMRRRLPGLSVGLAAMLRSLPTASARVSKPSSAGADSWSQDMRNRSGKIKVVISLLFPEMIKPLADETSSGREWGLRRDDAPFELDGTPLERGGRWEMERSRRSD